MSAELRVGLGYDIHPVQRDRPLILGGVSLQSMNGLGGHTDGDVVLHALIDSLLGAAGLEDIGTHFPDTDARYQGMPSNQLLEATMREIQSRGWAVHNADVTILAEQPKMGPHKQVIRESVCKMLGIDAECLSIKAKTNEGFDSVGSAKAIACHAVVLLSRSS